MSPVAETEAFQAVNGVAGLGTGTDGEDSPGVADPVGEAARLSVGILQTLIRSYPWDAATALRIVQDFLVGYGEGGAPYPTERIVAMVQCESSWNPLAVSPWGHKGLSQFSDYSWATVAGITGYWEWTDPWQMGYNTAVWMSMTEPSEQWACW